MVSMPSEIASEADLAAIKGHAPINTSNTFSTYSRKPAALADAALHGITGDVVRMLMPHTESGQAAVSIQFLLAAGLYIGRTGYYLAEGDRHYTNLFAAIVGDTSKGRKGTSWGQIRRQFQLTDAQFCGSCITSGLSSGEGLIWAVRDGMRESHPIREKGRISGYEEVITDPGITDKRLLAQEPEFARLLANAHRPGNNLSAVLREGWDTGDLRSTTKGSPAKATNAHIGIIAHITSAELNRLLTSTEAANGFANRFLWIYSERSKELPFGGSLTEQDLLPFAVRMRAVREWAQSAGRINFDARAADDWRRIYSSLSAGKPGLLGAALGRAEAQVVRMATLYTLLDCDTVIRQSHLHAALAVWDYAEASARYIFGEALGDETADTILGFLRRAGETGATRSELFQLFQKNKKSAEISRALGVLANGALARLEREQGESGAPVERWFASSGYVRNVLNAVSPDSSRLNTLNTSNTSPGASA
jgi:hypothetical protein